MCIAKVQECWAFILLLGSTPTIDAIGTIIMLDSTVAVYYMIKLHFCCFLVHSQYNVIMIVYIGEDSISR
jgi:hypothetical protein